MKKIVTEQIKKQSIVSICNQNFDDQDMSFLTKQNTDIIKQMRLKWNQISLCGALQFSKAKWSSLNKLDLQGNQIGDKGCKYLSRSKLINLKDLSLGDNYVGSGGIMHLSKANWKQTQILSLRSNKIGANGCLWLTKANFKKSVILSMNFNKLQFQQIIRLLLHPSKTLRKIIIDIESVLISEKKLSKLFSLKFARIKLSYQ